MERPDGEPVVGPPFADRVVQQADLAAGPEPGDEPVARGGVFEREAEPESAGRPAVVAPERELQGLIADVLPEHDDLVPFEDVGEPPGDQLAGASAGEGVVHVERRVGKYGPPQPGE